MSSVTESIDTLNPAARNGGYSVSAPVKEGAVRGSESAIEGNQSGDLFTTEEQGMQKDDFLRLLIAQLKHQDPLKPLDNSEFVSQVAQLRSLESSNNMQNTLEKLNSAFQGSVDAQKDSARSISNSSSVSLIGKQVKLTRETVHLHGTQEGPIPIDVHMGNTPRAVLQLVDADGNTVKTMEVEKPRGKTDARLMWDGTTDEGTSASPGKYTISFRNSDALSDVYAYIEDTVDGVRFGSDSSYLKIEGQEIPITQIMDVDHTESGTGATQSFSSAVGMLDRQVRIARHYVHCEPGTPKPVSVTMHGHSHVHLQIHDASGAAVARTTVTDSDGDGVGEVDVAQVLQEQTGQSRGDYRLMVEEARSDPYIYCYESGVVEGVYNGADEPLIGVNGTTVPLSRIMYIGST
jgi:flagellar basal-body rod modification protein FlgD